MSREIGLYIHIPFCVRKCAYCDFASYAGREEEMVPYTERLIAEMRRRARPDYRVATLYIGGGTPSLLPPRLMAGVLQAARESFSFLPGAECTCECNPGTISEEFLCVLRAGGINRLSLGAQASQPRLLSLLGRIHTWEDVVRGAALARRASFENLNLDLMLGLPTQTPEDAAGALEAALALSPTHLSCYGLIVEEGTPLKARVDQGEWTLPSEEAERAMYDGCREALARRGYAQYEISNFALPGFACRHNMDCWRRKEYVGVGSAACGFLGDIRYQNPPGLSDYLNGKAPEITRISPADARFESVMLGLRMTEGVSEAEFQRMHGLSLQEAFGPRLQKPLREGLVSWEKGRLRLTRRGMDMQNRVLVELL